MKDFTDRLRKYSGWIKFLILTGTLVFMFLKIRGELQELDQEGPGAVLIPRDGLYLLLLSLLLMPLNLSLEAWKWQTIAGKIEKISFRQSMAGILSGLTLGFVTPHAIGDYAGRIWQLKSSGRLQTIGGILVGRVSQFIATVSFGLIGIFYAPSKSINDITIYTVLVSFFVGIVAFLLMIINPHLLIRILEFVRFRKLIIYFRIMERYNWSNRWWIIGLSFARYLVFCFQFMIILYFFRVSDSWLILFSGASFIFLAKSILPSFNFLSDLGIREASAVYFFSWVGGAVVVPATLASLMLWGMNILLPAIIGLGLVWSMRIVRAEEKTDQ